MPETTVTTSPMPAPGDPESSSRALGARIRALRKSRGMTLTQAATEAELSHSFLSQVERGVERLSMASLFRIARALGTTQQALLTEDAGERPSGGFHIFRGEGDSPVDAGTGPVTILAQQHARFVPMIFSGSFTDATWWQHDEEEFIFVLEGEVIVVIDEDEISLSAGDSTYYEGGVRHKWRTPEGATCRVLVVKEQQHSS